MPSRQIGLTVERSSPVEGGAKKFMYELTAGVPNRGHTLTQHRKSTVTLRQQTARPVGAKH